MVKRIRRCSGTDDDSCLLMSHRWNVTTFEMNEIFMAGGNGRAGCACLIMNE